MNQNRKPAKVFPPGEFVKDEMEARGWTQTDLAEILGRPVRVVNEIISGKRGISPETAQGLGAAFGTSAQLWLNLEASYQLSRIDSTDGLVGKRGALYAKGPLKEMVRRGWIKGSENIDDLTKGVLGFFEIHSIEDEPRFSAHAARRSRASESLTPAQTAWLFRVRQLARGISLDNDYRKDLLDKAVDKLRRLLPGEAGIAHVPNVLAEAGIRFLVVEPLPRTGIDGACFWLDRRSPVLVVSLRFDRIDYFWHTLMHEIAHVKNGDGATPALDIDLVGQKARHSDTKSEPERRADEFAAQALVPQDSLEDFIDRTRPLYSKARIEVFAKKVGVHPGIVVGQLQYRAEISYAYNREMLVKVRDAITRSALTDGWGRLPAAA
ncbi:MAG: HigA family addiction module antidote protein [Chloroflexi bacterium]|nr:HigA family addiction module antidote protein [Chloroflexota bacterium]